MNKYIKVRIDYNGKPEITEITIIKETEKQIKYIDEYLDERTINKKLLGRIQGFRNEIICLSQDVETALREFEKWILIDIKDLELSLAEKRKHLIELNRYKNNLNKK